MIPPTDDPDPASGPSDNIIRFAAFGGSEGATFVTDQPAHTPPPPFADLNGIADDEKERDFGRDNPKADEPWPDAVDGATTLDEIAGFVNQYMEMPPGGTDLVTLFPPTAFALHRCEFDYAPRLMIVGEKDSGKSNLMKILSGLCPRPYLSSDITKAPLFRTVHERKPTILIDESHFNLREHPELLTVLHQGWDYETARTTRLEGKMTQTFYTFAIAILAGVGDWGGDELKSRSFIIELIRNRERSIPKFLTRPSGARLETLRRKMLRWTRDNRDTLMTVEPELPTLVSRNRIGDLASTLLRVADVAGCDWPQRARDAISLIAAENVLEDDDLGRTLLTALCETIHDPDLILHYQNAEGRTPKRKACEADFFWTVELVKALNSRHDLPFEKLNGHQIGRIFRAYRRAKIRPDQRMLGGRGTPNWKGYHRADLQRAFDLYGIKRPTVRDEAGQPPHPVIVRERESPVISPLPVDASPIIDPVAQAPEPSAIPLDAAPTTPSSGIALPHDAPIMYPPTTHSIPIGKSEKNRQRADALREHIEARIRSGDIEPAAVRFRGVDFWILDHEGESFFAHVTLEQNQRVLQMEVFQHPDLAADGEALTVHVSDKLTLGPLAKADFNRLRSQVNKARSWMNQHAID